MFKESWYNLNEKCTKIKQHYCNTFSSAKNMQVCSTELHWQQSLCFSSCLDVIIKALFQLSLSANSAGIVRHFKHQHTNVGWHTINAPDFHWLTCFKEKPWLVFSLQQDYMDALLSNLGFLHLNMFIGSFSHSFMHFFIQSFFLSFIFTGIIENVV